MPSAATAGTATGDYDDGSGHDNNFFATIRAASAHRTAMKARTTTAFNLDDHVGRSLARGKRQGPRGATR